MPTVFPTTPPPIGVWTSHAMYDMLEDAEDIWAVTYSLPNNRNHAKGIWRNLTRLVYVVEPTTPLQLPKTRIYRVTGCHIKVVSYIKPSAFGPFRSVYIGSWNYGAFVNADWMVELRGTVKTHVQRWLEKEFVNLETICARQRATAS